MTQIKSRKWLKLLFMQLREQFSLCRIYQRSKCTRAFDRRPPTAASTHDQAAVQNYHHRDSNDQAVITFDNQQNPGVESEINWGMATENELLWDSEVVDDLLDRFDIWSKMVKNLLQVINNLFNMWLWILPSKDLCLVA